MSEPAPETNAQSTRRALATLALLSASGLFLELALIRLVPGSVRVVGYFTNLILIAAFLGLGAGALLSRFEAAIFRWWPAALLGLIAATLILGSAQTVDPAGEHIWSGEAPHIGGQAVGWLAGLTPWLKTVTTALAGTSFYVVITVLFVGTAIFFTLLGHRIGRLFEHLPPLRAYGADLLGSIAGVIAFTLCAQLSTPPVVWLALGCAALALVTPWRGAAGVARAVAVALVLILVAAAGAPYVWSPYYKIEVSPVTTTNENGGEEAQPLGWRVRVNNDYHQMALDLSDAPTRLDDADPALASPAEGRQAFLAGWRRLYDLPYAGHEAGRVLVVGAGTGNDVQAALRNGATSVTAVEIDPGILALGRSLHPERPYDDPRVTVVIDDARSFLAHIAEDAGTDPSTTAARFDTIVFGFLDSHTLLSSFSTLRIDNYVYTVESFGEAARSLAPGGRLAVTFTTATTWLKQRLFGLMTVALGQPPQTTRVPWTNGRIFWSDRPERWQPSSAEAVAAVAAEEGLPTDDWPFLYLAERGLPGHYLFFMVLVVGLGLLSFGLIERTQRRVNAELFFLGAGFMLLETRSVTEIALLFGSTWAVNAITFGAILIAVLAANTVAMRWPRPPVRLLYAGVVALLIVGWALDPGQLRAAPFALRLPLAALFFFSPIALAGVVFSTRFRASTRPNLLFGSNLLGAMVGGALEYLGMALGLEALYLIGAVLYLLALVVGLKRS